MQILPYIQLARLHRPIGIWLLLWPCFCGLAIGHGSLFDYLLFFIGAVVMRSAGCIINDMIDQDVDAKVERTKTRPLAAKILRRTQAFIALCLFLCIGLGVWLFLSLEAKYLSILGGCMMVAYPFMKRITNWPQLFLGFTFNIGLLIALAHTHTLQFSWAIASLFIGFVLWTIFYDTIYAFADIEDDLKAQVKSTAIVMQNNPKLWLTLVNIFIHFALLMYCYEIGWAWFIPVFAGTLFLQFCLFEWNPNDPQDCIKVFRKCHYWGLLECGGLEMIRIISP